MSMKGVTQVMEAQENERFVSIMSNDKELTYGDIYRDFCNWSPEHAAMVVDYRPWGHTSILVWLNNGQAYKCKRHAAGRFTMQLVSEEDIKKKYGI